MARSGNKATVKRVMVIIHERSNGVDKYIRRPYDLVEYNWGGGEIQNFLQLRLGDTRFSTLPEKYGATTQREEYDDIRIYHTRPEWDYNFTM